MLSLICGSLCVAEGIISSNFETFKTSLERGQTQPATILKNHVKMELVYEGMKYCLRVTKTGKLNYMMELGEQIIFTKFLVKLTSRKNLYEIFVKLISRKEYFSWFFFLDQSKKDVEAYPMTDGQYLVLVDGQTHMTYMQESADSYR